MDTRQATSPNDQATGAGLDSSPKDSPVVSGEDLLDIRDQILGWIRRHARHEQATAGPVRSLGCTWCPAPAGQPATPGAALITSSGTSQPGTPG
jgi:hypothetical protein